MKTTVLKLLVVVLALSVFQGLNAQKGCFVLNGKVIDAKTSRPIAKVKVEIKATKKVCFTNMKGDFQIVAAKGQELTFTHPDYVPLNFKVNNPRLIVKLSRGNREPQMVRASIAFPPPVISQKAPEAIMSQSCMLSKRAAISTVTMQGNTSADAIMVPQQSMPSFVPTAPQNDEEYKQVAENEFKSVSSEPLSTFSLDVDAASYSNVRRMINAGNMPNKDAVRVEEMINYFSYKYPQPTNADPVRINTEIHPCPWAEDHLLLRIGVKAKEIPSAKLPASNFVFLIDVSGSMDEPNKLPLVKSSLKLLTNNLREKDRVAIVVYAGQAGLVLPSTSGADKQKIFDALEHLQAGGSTAGGDGIELAYKIAIRNFVRGGNNRVILCTDGDFNVGVSSDGELERLIENKRRTGVYLSILGYGVGNYKDSKMQVLSQKGNGNNAYIDNLQEANKVLVNEFGSTMYAVAKDVKIQVEFNPAKVSAYRLVGYETRLLNKEDFNDDTKDAGELGAGHTVTAFYEVVPAHGTYEKKVDDLRYQKAQPEHEEAGSPEMLFVKLRYKPLDSDRSLKIEKPVMYPTEGRENMSADYAFASSVAMFGQLLKDSEFKGTATYDDVLSLANKGLDEDKNGYRREFVRLVESVNQLSK